MWDLVSDTEEFWTDVATLYKASVQGHTEAFRTLLTIGTYTDGAVSEGMPDLVWVVQEYPEMASEIIMRDPRLRKHFKHWVDERGHRSRTGTQPAHAGDGQ